MDTSTVVIASSLTSLTRVIGAPIASVWRAWTNPERFSLWWGPHAFATPLCMLDVRTGGEWHVVMRSPEGRITALQGTYAEVAPAERLVMHGTGTCAPFHCAVSFQEHEGATLIRIRYSPSADGTSSIPMDTAQAWGQSMDRLEELLLLGRVQND